MDEQERARIVAQQNDTFRQWWIEGVGELSVPGRVFMTQGVHGLLEETNKLTRDLLPLVGRYADFSADNDPWGERDFGIFNFEGERLYWKIDLFSDETMRAGSEEPTNLAKTYRVLTIMLQQEY